MKKILLFAAIVALASLSTVQADDKAKACPATAKTACASEAKSCADKTATTCADKAKASGCCPGKAVTKTKADSTAKGASHLIAKR